MAIVQQLPARLDLEAVSTDPLTLTITVSGATITAPAVTVTSIQGVTVSGAGPTVSVAGSVITVAWSAANMAALYGQSSSFAWSLSGTVNAGSAFQLIGGNLTVDRVGTAGSSTTTTAALAITVGGASVTCAVTLGGSSQPLPTAVKTANYSANASELVPVDCTSGVVTVTLPSAPTNGSRVIVKKIDSSTNAVTIACGGSDHFNTSSGPTSGTLSLQYQAMTVEYATALAVWYVIGDDLPLSQLDLRYVTDSTLTVDGQLVTRASGVPAAITRANLAADTAFSSRYGTVPTTVTTTYVAVAGDYVLADTTSASFTVTMPFPANNTDRVTIKNIGGNPLTVAPGAGDTIDGRSSQVINAQNAVYTYIYNSATLRWERATMHLPYLDHQKQVDTDTSSAGANTNYCLMVANQIMANSSPSGEHDLVLVAANNVTGANSGVDYDIRMEREQGSSGVLFINLPLKTATDFIFTDNANSETFRITATGGRAKMAATLIGNQGANLNLIVQNGGGSAIMSFRNSSGTELMRFTETLVQMPNATEFHFVGASGGQYGSMQVTAGNTFAIRLAGSGAFQIVDSSNANPMILARQTGSVLVGKSAPATNATAGFVYVPVMAGAPSGTPTAETGYVALCYDSTNNKLWVYNGAWKGVVLA